MIKERHQHACAMFKSGGNEILVVSPGYESPGTNTELLNLGANRLEWIEGPSLEEHYSHEGHQMVSNGDFVYYINTYSNVIFILDCRIDLSCRWIKMQQKLDFPRLGAVAVLVPDELTECS